MTTTRRVRRSLGLTTRDSSAVRRAALAPAIADSSTYDDGALARLCTTRWGVAAGELKRRALDDLRYALRAEGKHAAIDLARHVEGTWLDRLAPTIEDKTRRALALAVAREFLRLVHEHALTSATAVRHALRAAAHGALADHYLGRLLAGAADDDARKLADRLTTSARTETMTALAIEAQARAAREASGSGWDAETMAKFEAIVGADSRGASARQLPPMPPDAASAPTRLPRTPDSASEPPQPGLSSHEETDR